MRTFLIIVVLLVAAAAGGLLWLAGDANRFKPQVEAELSKALDRPVSLNGDLGWSLWPPVTLTATDIVTTDDETVLKVGELRADIDAFTLLKPSDEWTVNSVTLLNVSQVEDDTELFVREFQLGNFRLGQASEFSAQGRYTSGDVAYPFSADGTLTYDAEADRLAIIAPDADLAGTNANCQATVSGLTRDSVEPFSDDELVPTDTFRQYDWDGTCTLPSLAVADTTFRNAELTFSNRRGQASNTLAIPEFFGGSAKLSADIDARRRNVGWHFKPDMQDVDSEALMAWLDQNLQWAAPLGLGGEMRATGNSVESIARSLKGNATFNGGTGAISIATIRNQLLTVAQLAGDPEKVQGWPELLDYQVLDGNWQIDGERSTVRFQLDNLNVDARGKFDPLTEEIDMAVDLTFRNLPELRSFDVNDYLIDLPIPMRCTGTTTEPKCSVDSQGIQRLVARVLTGNSNDALRGKLDEAIDKEVPEEYREAARGLLDILGGRKRDKDEE